MGLMNDMVVRLPEVDSHYDRVWLSEARFATVRTGERAVLVLELHFQTVLSAKTNSTPCMCRYFRDNIPRPSTFALRGSPAFLRRALVSKGDVPSMSCRVWVSARRG